MRLLTPRTCPLCEYPFAPADGHQVLVDEAELARLTEGHDRRAHAGGLRWYLRSISGDPS